MNGKLERTLKLADLATEDQMESADNPSELRDSFLRQVEAVREGAAELGLTEVSEDFIIGMVIAGMLSVKASEMLVEPLATLLMQFGLSVNQVAAALQPKVKLEDMPDINFVLDEDPNQEAA